MGEIRKSAEKNKLGYSIEFAYSSAFGEGLSKLVEDMKEKYGIEYEDYKFEIGVFFLVDSLAKTDILLDEIMWAYKPDKIQSLIKKARKVLHKKKLPPDLINAVKELRVNIAVASCYFRELFWNSYKAPRSILSSN